MEKKVKDVADFIVVTSMKEIYKSYTICELTKNYDRLLLSNNYYSCGRYLHLQVAIVTGSAENKERYCIIILAKSLNTNLNLSRPSEHTPVRGGKKVKTFRWDHRPQIQNLYMAFKRVPHGINSNIGVHFRYQQICRSFLSCFFIVHVCTSHYIFHL